jgi:hypothetical protein
MYQAIGRAVKKNADGTYTVKVEIQDDRTGATVRFGDYTVNTMLTLRQLIAADLQTLVAAETDATLSKAFVNVQLGSI